MFNANLISRGRVQRALLISLCLFSLLLLSAVAVAWRTVYHINQQAQDFTMRQTMAKQAIVGIEEQQAELNSRWLNLARKKNSVSRDEILAQSEQNREDMASALEDAYEQAELLRESIFKEGHGLLRWTVWIFGSFVVLSIISASWAVGASTQLFKRLEMLQYQFLETQENIARRFSHELHDELGQALAAVKANLSAMGKDEARVEDCMVVVDQAIQNVREMSQLLRPTILDDFGLEAALRVLTESFAKRTGISLTYDSELGADRLPDETETNLYRITQEALTNVARHSGATQVNVAAKKDERQVAVRIQDNGKGLDLAARQKRISLGLAGMETRARGCGGSVQLTSAAGKGLKVEVTCPIGR